MLYNKSHFSLLHPGNMAQCLFNLLLYDLTLKTSFFFCRFHLLNNPYGLLFMSQALENNTQTACHHMHGSPPTNTVLYRQALVLMLWTKEEKLSLNRALFQLSLVSIMQYTILCIMTKISPTRPFGTIEIQAKVWFQCFRLYR